MPEPYQEELYNRPNHSHPSSLTSFATSTHYGKRYVLATPRSADTDNCKTIVHGSLARAGKVKSQTPKVDKQEKKKTPKGRAKKRMLYNRR